MRESRIFSNAIIPLIPRCSRCDIIAFSARAKARDKLIIQWKLLRGIRAKIWSIPQEPREILSVNFSARSGVTHTHIHTILSPHRTSVRWSNEEEWAEGWEAFGTYGEKGNVHRVLVGKPDRTKQLDRHTCRWKGDIANSLKGGGCKGVDLINLP